MSKSDRIYKIFMTTMIVIIAGILLATGIIAIQKSMKMNLSFETNPNYLFEVYIQKSGDDTKKLVFRNYEKSASEGVVMENGFSTLYGNTLTADDTFLETYGGDFEFIIENHTKNSGMRVSVTANSETEGGHEGILPTITEDKMTATKLKDGSTADYIRFGVTTTEAVFPQTTVLNIVFSEYNEYTVTVTPSSGNFTFSDTTNKIAVSDEDYTANIKATTGYNLTISITNDGGTTTLKQNTDYTWDSSTGALTIYASAVTGDITIYAQWTERIYTITFTSTTNNLQVNSINGTTATPLTSLDMKTTETKNVVVTSTTAGQWSRSATYSVTSGSATVSFDSLTGDLTITNPTADTTINVSVSDSDTFRPWTYGTYVNNEGSAVGDKVSYNTVHYPAFKGYKYIQFANHATQEANYYKSAAGDIGARWIIIGAGSSVSNATMLGAVQNTAVTSYAFSGIVNGKVGNNSKNDNLGDSQVLLLSEQTLKTNVFNSSSSDGSEWKTSAIRNLLNEEFLTNSGLNTYINSSPSYIVQPNTNLNTAYKPTSGSVTSSTDTTTNNKSSYIFLLGSRYGYLGTNDAKASVKADMGTDSSVAAATKTTYYGQNFVVEDYLGTDDATITLDGVTYSGGDYTRGTSTAPKLASFTGATSSYWWLRSGYYNNYFNACSVTSYGYVNIISAYGSNGVRPSFILNLA